MATKNDWIAAINALAPDFQITEPRLGLESPQFIYGSWKIGTEHKENYHFQTLVLGWLDDKKDMPVLEESPLLEDRKWKKCPESEQARNWHYRIWLAPHDLRSLLTELDSITQSDIRWRQAFGERVRSSLQDSAQSRQERLARASRFPRRVVVTTTIFERNSDVVAEILLRANGKCEGCLASAPFKRRFDGSPYLEVHHRTPLSKGGEDTVENAIALCPNCHRKLHYG